MEKLYGYSVRDENIGTVLDSVAAVLSEMVGVCISGVFPENLQETDIDWPKIAGNFQNGRGVGHESINKYEPSIPSNSARSAIDCFKATDNGDI